VDRIVLASRARAHEFVLLALSLLLGVTYLLGAPPPQSAAATMPHWLVTAWAAGLAVSGLAGLLSAAVIRWRDTSLMLEAGAMLIGAGALVLITAAIAVYSGARGMLGAGLCLGWALANLVRAEQIRREIRELT
jgi:hypothetical protein